MDMKKLKPLEELLDSVRDIEGFPIGKDEDILNLSNAPYYTACPNPYINDFIDAYGKPYDPETDTYDRKPFVGDVSEGKNDPIYMAHTYHTKVPHKAIMEYINHYTNEGDIVLDGFGGSGMTGIASSILNRKSITFDISPFATFMQNNYLNFNIKKDDKENFYNILDSVYKKYSWVYETNHPEAKDELQFSNSLNKGIITHTIWSDELSCPFCKTSFNFWSVAVDKKTNIVSSEYNCPHCSAKLDKSSSVNVEEKYFDKVIGEEITRVKKVPVKIIYEYNGKKYEKFPDEDDLSTLLKIEKLEIPYKFPLYKMMNKGVNWGDSWRKGYHQGYTYVHHFFEKRTLWILSAIWSEISILEKDQRNYFWWVLTSVLQRSTKLFRWNAKQSGPLSGTLYIASLVFEVSIFKLLKNKNTIFNLPDYPRKNSLISTQSVSNMTNIKKNSLDYIFTDPPFGDNLMYSELNFIWESWLHVLTNTKAEAIINKSQNKDIYDYKVLMSGAMKEYYRVLKPNRWITVEFHNSKASVWNAIQDAITKAGFIIAQVAVLDKQQGSFKQVTSAGAVSKDLVINAYKPKEEFKRKFIENAGEGMEIEFVRQQLNHLPIEPNIERTEQMLYSKMLAHYLESGYRIKYNSQNFFELLEDNFAEIDGFWFDEAEVNRYNEWKSKQGNLDKIKNLIGGGNVLFISDEKSALTWVYNFLNEPKTYSDILTAYNQIYTANNDEIPELKELLDNNFFTTDGKYRKPDTRQERQELKKNREKELDRAWNKILEKLKNEKKKIKNIRKEALLYGMQKCYDTENYKDILIVADKLHASILEENSDISDFVDIALIKSEANKEGTLF